MKKYSDNIELIKIVKGSTDLKEDEYYALMVEDEFHKHQRPYSDFFDYDKGYIGLERTGDRIYISKDFNKRNANYRGYTFIVLVKDPSKCCEL